MNSVQKKSFKPHEGVRFPYKHCSYEATRNEKLKNTRRKCIRGSNTLTNIVAVRQLNGEILKYIRRQCMKESITLANIASMKQLENHF